MHFADRVIMSVSWRMFLMDVGDGYQTVRQAEG